MKQHFEAEKLNKDTFYQYYKQDFKILEKYCEVEYSKQIKLVANKNVEQSSFVPLVFSCTGGAASSAQKMTQNLAKNQRKTRQVI